MPVYEYTCLKCGARSEFVESLGMGRVAARKCGTCGSSRLKKAASAFAYHKEVTLEDLGVKVNYRPAPGGMGGTGGMGEGVEMPSGPPPGGCPYCQGETPAETTVLPNGKPGAGDKGR